MAYHRNNLISRVGYSGMGSTDGAAGGVGSVIGSVIGWFSNRQAQQTAEAQSQASRDLAAAMAAQQGGSFELTPTTLAIGAAAVAGAIYLYRRHKRG